MTTSSPSSPPPDPPPLPSQPDGLAWPTSDWDTAPGPEPLRALIDVAFDPEAGLGQSYAVLVVHRGRLVAERYGGSLPHLDRPAEPVGPDTALLSWSMAKSVLHALVGVAVDRELLDPRRPPPGIPWSGPAPGRPAEPHDPRRDITLQQMLEMRDGLDFNEDYVDDQESDTIAMLFGSGRSDVVSYAAARPLRHPPGERFNYSSGTSNLISAALSSVVGRGEDLVAFAHESLFSTIGMTSARLGFDDAGHWIASSYLYARGRDWARFGYLYLRGGHWDGRQVVPATWVDQARRLRSLDAVDGGYGAHWWVIDDGRGTFRAGGYAGQSVVVSPSLDLVLVRLGDSPASSYPALADWRARVLEVFDSHG